MYRKQVELLINLIPCIGEQKCFAMHGGTAINLFIRDVPRLSVDIDLTYLPIETRNETLKNIKIALQKIEEDILKKRLCTNVSVPSDGSGETKLFCNQQGIQIKIEVNTTMRGSLEPPKLMQLNEKAQELFNQWAEIQVISTGQLYGGKICAALDRQHPRDLFDVKYMFNTFGLTSEIKQGFIFCLLSCNRPLHEILKPILSDQKNTMINHFEGMALEPFTYEEFEKIRTQLIETVNQELNENEKHLLISFTEGSPNWNSYGFSEFEKFPAIQWKLKNILKLKASNPQKHLQQLEALKKQLGTI